MLPVWSRYTTSKSGWPFTDRTNPLKQPASYVPTKSIWKNSKVHFKYRKTDVEKEGLIYAQKLGLPHFNVSAKTGEHINEMFDGIIEAINSIARETRESK
jgi:hypothetical protein